MAEEHSHVRTSGGSDNYYKFELVVIMMFWDICNNNVVIMKISTISVGDKEIDTDDFTLIIKMLDQPESSEN